MARKDVDLVIRAKDQAQGAISAVTKALEDFVASQKDIQREAGKTDSTLGRLGKSLADLKGALGGVGASAKITGELQKARASMESLTASTKETATATRTYAREAREAARESARASAESDRAAIAVKKQAAALKEAQAAQATLNTVTTKAVADRKRLVEADAKLTAQIQEQRLQLALGTASFRQLQQQISDTSGPTDKLEAKLARLGGSIKKVESTLDEYRATQAQVRASIDATSRTVTRANDIYGGAAGGINKQKAALASLIEEQRRVQASASAAAENLRKLEAAAARSKDGFQRNAAELRKAREAYAELQRAAGQVEGSLASLEAKLRGPLLKAFGQQSATVNTLQKEFRETSAEASRLAREMASTATPTEKLKADFEQARSAAARARQEFRLQQAALGELRNILRESGGDVDAMASRQERFRAAVARAAAALAANRAATAAAAAAAAQGANAAQRAAAAAAAHARELEKQAAAARRAATETRTLAGAVRAFYGESRTALSFTQRLRSEVLSLIAAYGGFYAVIDGIRSTVNAYKALEAATNRLNVVFDGDQQAVAQELDFLRRNAERLGVEFGALANEYTKFAVATKGTNLAGAETRRIFVSVTEAARVNGSSLEQIQGVFVALTQIVSKGTVSMEELRQQLGDRLPGAIQLMAAAAGVGVAELTKMIEQGQLSSDILSKFADELDKKFGSQLAASLTGLTAEMGRLQDAFFNAFVTIANGGFIERFTALIRDLNETIRSAQFESFLGKISVAMGAAADAVAFLARNFDIVVIAITAFVGLKVVPFIIFLIARMGLLTGATVSTTRGFAALRAALASGAVSMTRTQVAVRGLTIALRGLLSSTGIGLAVVAIAAAIGFWATRTEEATGVLSAHEALVDRVRNAYDQVGASVEEWRASLEGVTVVAATTNLESLQRELKNTRDAFEDAIPRDIFGNASNAGGGYFKAVSDLFEELKSGSITVDVFRTRLDALGVEYRDLFPVNAQFADSFDALAGRMDEASDRTTVAQDILLALTGTTEEAEAAIRRLSGAVEESADAQDDANDRWKKSNDALNELRKLVPDIAAQMEILDEKAKLKSALDAALQLAQSYSQVVEALRLYGLGLDAIEGRQALQIFQGVSGSVESAAALLREFEGRGGQSVAEPYYDVNAFRAGFGSDTITLADGSVRAVVEGIAVSVEDANRDLVRRVGEFQDVVRGQIGTERFGSFDNAQQAVLTSIAYNYGSLPERILDAVRNGTTAEISSAIRGLSGDNDGVNAGRREREATIFGAGAANQDITPYVEAERERVRLLERQAEERERARLATQDTLADGEFEIEQQRLILAGREREAAIQEAIRSAREQNADIGEQELAQIAVQAGQLFDLAEQQKNLRTEKELAEEGEKRVNDLLTLRQQLNEELAAQIERGNDPSAVAGLREALVEVNTQLQDAIQSALELFEALGSSDPAVAAVIARLRTLAITSGETSRGVKLNWAEVEQVLASSLVNAANKFAESLAEGKSVTESLADAFRQFAADFLRQIAQMILQQLALNAAKAIGKVFGFGVAHQGGVIGAQGAKRSLNMGNVGNIMRYHSGGVAGLAPNEVPTILERGEEVLTSDDPRHIFNMGKGGGGGAEGSPRFKIVNAFNTADLLSEALSTRDGEEAILNHVRQNPAAFRAAING